MCGSHFWKMITHPGPRLSFLAICLEKWFIMAPLPWKRNWFPASFSKLRSVGRHLLQCRTELGISQRCMASSHPTGRSDGNQWSGMGSRRDVVEKQKIFFEKEEDVVSVMSPQIWITFITVVVYYFGSDIILEISYLFWITHFGWIHIDINLHSPRPWMTSLPPAFVTQQRRCNVGVVPRPWPLGVKAWHLGIVSQQPRGVLRGWRAELEERRTKRNENNKS